MPVHRRKTSKRFKASIHSYAVAFKVFCPVIATVLIFGLLPARADSVSLKARDAGSVCFAALFCKTSRRVKRRSVIGRGELFHIGDQISGSSQFTKSPRVRDSRFDKESSRSRYLIEPAEADHYHKASNSDSDLPVLMSNSEVQNDFPARQVNEPRGAVSQEFLPLVYKELRELAAARMAREMEGQTLQPTALVHEAWLRLQSHSAPVWRNRAHFFSAASEAMRRILIERARRKLRLKRGHRAEHVSIENVDVAQTEPDQRILLIDDALRRLNATDPELARIVTLKFFGGLTNVEVAETLGVTERTIHNKWTFAKAWLLKSIREERNPEA